MIFSRPRRVLSTDLVSEVRPIIAEVQAAVEAGEWAFGYVSYEAAPAFEPGLAVAARTWNDPPLIWFGLGDAPAEERPIAAPRHRPPTTLWQPDRTAEQYAATVADVRERIAAGEVYQCNLTERLRTSLVGDPLQLYASLITAQKAAHNAYLDTGGRFVIASASPELFFEWAGDRIRTRPMKGTATRGHDPEEDRQRARALRASEKERAENVMIVDLLRNDLGKFAEVNSVCVTELFAVEGYPTVWQMVSEITARMPPSCELVDIFAALFPCGSITGAPKASSMRIIRELEDTPRGVYCGAIGVVAPPTATVRARFSVAIRTAVIDRVTGAAVYGAGGGITWGSNAHAEWAELLSKAAILSHPKDEHIVSEREREPMSLPDAPPVISPRAEGVHHGIDLDAAVSAAGQFLKALGISTDNESMLNTPQRMAEAYRELFTAPGFDATTFPNDEGYDELVIVREIAFQTVCEHHLLPFFGKATVAYLPDERILGLSKLARLVEHFARRPQVQERLTKQVADWLEANLKPKGVGVLLEATHTCMSMRGVRAIGATTVTSTMLGRLRTDPRSRQEFLTIATSRTQ
ncbi:aminodeoxychorismate synthase component I [Actinoplanes philippinensis]|uniref:aminodeoxychorismate synthase component I n=1 Tax=Actinoplanes philippinensis TaxID=35752 RepID=UPI0033DE097B